MTTKSKHQLEALVPNEVRSSSVLKERLSATMVYTPTYEYKGCPAVHAPTMLGPLHYA